MSAAKKGLQVSTDRRRWATVAGGGDPGKRPPNDYYPTPPAATRVLLNREEFPGPVLEPCAGAGHVVRVLEEYGYQVFSNELYPQGFFKADSRRDFLAPRSDDGWPRCRSIVTNPPYRHAQAFIQRAIDMGIEKHAWLLRFQFLESGERYAFFQKHPPRRLWVFSERIQVSERGLVNPRGGMVVFAWWVWERDYSGRPELCWIEPGAIDRCHFNSSLVGDAGVE